MNLFFNKMNKFFIWLENLYIGNAHVHFISIGRLLFHIYISHIYCISPITSYSIFCLVPPV